MFNIINKVFLNLQRRAGLSSVLVAVAVLMNTEAHVAQAQINTVASDNANMFSAADLIDELFKDPTNLQLNFRVMQAQIAEGNLEGAESTLERVLILDPKSTLAKILIADIKIKLGKFTSARLILDQLIQSPSTPGQTRDRAKELAAQINNAINPVKIRGGYAVYTGVTGNAFGRSQEDKILFGDTVFNNTTKKGSDEFTGFFAYINRSRELNVQTPTIIEYGASINGRDKSDPSLSDTATLTVNATLKRNGAHRISAGASAGYSEVNNKDFSRSVGVFASFTIPIKYIAEITQSLSANQTVFYDYDGIAGNKDKTNNSVTATSEFSRPTPLALFKLSLSAGRAYAKGDIYDVNHEKAEFSILTLYRGFSLSSSISRQWLRYQHADAFISTKAQKTTTDEASLNIRYAQGFQSDDVNYVPFVKLSAKDSDSNIPNYRREGSEVSMGVEGSF